MSFPLLSQLDQVAAGHLLSVGEHFPFTVWERKFLGLVLPRGFCLLFIWFCCCCFLHPPLNNPDSGNGSHDLQCLFFTVQRWISHTLTVPVLLFLPNSHSRMFHSVIHSPLLQIRQPLAYMMHLCKHVSTKKTPKNPPSKIVDLQL